MAIATSTALTISALAALAGAGYGAYAGEKSASGQRKALRRQDAAQDQAEAQAAADRKRAEEEQNRANQKQPDLGAILGAERQFGEGAGSTLLTGPDGITRDRLRLSKQSLLGG